MMTWVIRSVWLWSRNYIDMLWTCYPRWNHLRGGLCIPPFRSLPTVSVPWCYLDVAAVACHTCPCFGRGTCSLPGIHQDLHWNCNRGMNHSKWFRCFPASTALCQPRSKLSSLLLPGCCHNFWQEKDGGLRVARLPCDRSESRWSGSTTSRWHVMKDDETSRFPRVIRVPVQFPYVPIQGCYMLLPTVWFLSLCHPKKSFYVSKKGLCFDVGCKHEVR